MNLTKQYNFQIGLIDEFSPERGNADRQRGEMVRKDLFLLK